MHFVPSWSGHHPVTSLSFFFDAPAYLALFALLPVIWWISHRSLQSLGVFRYSLAILFRSALLSLLVVALAEIHLVRVSEGIAAYFLIDQSTSIDPRQREAVFAYANAAVKQHQVAAKGDQAGVIVFGRDAQIEQPPQESGVMPVKRETPLDESRTNIADALKIAKGSFPDGLAKRIVLISDGNQNLGDAVIDAHALADQGIGFDVVPLPRRITSDILIEKIIAPTNSYADAPHDVSVVVDYQHAPELKSPPPVTGRLTVTRRSGLQTIMLAEEQVTLEPGKNVFRFRDELEVPGFYTREATFVADDAASDAYSQNNRAFNFTQVPGKGRVLFIVDAMAPEGYQPLIEMLRKNGLDITVQTTDSLFTRLADLQEFDSVVLADVARSGRSQSENVIEFSDAQSQLLVHNVEQMGAGLIMLGGPQSFGAGGWENSPLEKAMPVDFRVDNAKVKAVSAVMLVIDRSGSMAGLKLQMAKAAATEALRMLSPMDHIGIITFDSEAQEVIKLGRKAGQANKAHARITRIGSGGGTNLDPAIRLGYERLEKINASVKHMIVLTDGQTAGSGYSQLAARNRSKGVTTTAVAMGGDADFNLMRELAQRGSGKFYKVTNPKIVPKIFIEEMRRVVRPSLYEDEKGLPLIVAGPHEILSGAQVGIPPITGFVLTTTKQNPLVETPLLSTKPGSPNDSVLATWQYGAGRVAAFTSDAGQRWTKDWSGWADRDRFFTQLIRWSLRPQGEHRNYSLTTDLRDGKLIATLQALNDSGDFISNLPVEGSVIDDKGTKAQLLDFRAIAPGRYQASFPLEKEGSYLLAVKPSRGEGVLRSGINVPFSPEFNQLQSNGALLTSLASLRPKQGAAGAVIELPSDPESWKSWQGPNVFRRDLLQGRRFTNVWPFVLLISAVLFFADIFNRRVAVPWGAIAEKAASWLPRKAQLASAPDHRLQRLRAVKSRAALQAPHSLQIVEQSQVLEPVSDPLDRETPQPAPAMSEAPVVPNDDYTLRLLRTKRSLRKD